jgi:hypothetical protein
MYGSATVRYLPTQKKQRIADLLSQIIETLDLTKTQYANIESAYTLWENLFLEAEETFNDMLHNTLSGSVVSIT